MMDRSDAPAMAAVLACPARRECPAYLVASKPARSTSFFTTRATSIPDSRPEALAENSCLGHVRHARLRAPQSAGVVEMRGLILPVIRLRLYLGPLDPSFGQSRSRGAFCVVPPRPTQSARSCYPQIDRSRLRTLSSSEVRLANRKEEISCRRKGTMQIRLYP